VGGFTKIPGENDLDLMLSLLKGMRPDIEATLQLFSTLSFPAFERDTEFVGLVTDGDDYPLIEGDIGSTDGIKMDKHDYKKATNEFIVHHSSAKHSRLSRDSYFTGAIARFNLNYKKLNEKAKKAAEFLGLKPKVINPYLNTCAQLVECAQCLEDSIMVIEDLKSKGINIDEEIVVGLNEQGTIAVKAGNGVGAVEVPRGILYHNYEIDDKGRIINANCIIPTSQNAANIEYDMRKLVPEILDKNEDEISHALEMLVRAYDLCISCSTHFLNVSFINR
jgi:coenzyme F420-reducing hydrogenase alpha subunit